MTVRLLSVPSLTENNISAVEEGFKLSEYLSCIMLCLSRKGNKLCYIAADIFRALSASSAPSAITGRIYI